MPAKKKVVVEDVAKDTVTESVDNAQPAEEKIEAKAESDAAVAEQILVTRILELEKVVAGLQSSDRIIAEKFKITGERILLIERALVSAGVLQPLSYSQTNPSARGQVDLHG